MIFDIVKGSNVGRSKSISCTDVVNFYPEVEVADKSKYTKAFIGCPGYRNAVTAYSTGDGRGIYTTSTERLFVIVGNKLVEISSAETATVRGTLSTSTGMCVMCDNGTQLFITDGAYGYVYTLATNTLALVSDADYPVNTTHCIFTDGYFLVVTSDSGKFYFSASYDGTSWDALEFATAEYSADTLQGIAKTSNGTIWMFGKQSLEQWSNVGVSELPWRRISGSVKEIGCIAPYSIASNGNQVFFIGNGQHGYAAVYMGTGYDVVRISTPAIEYKLKQSESIAETVGFSYSDEGHSFYVLSVASEFTLVYDMSTGEWHRRGSYSSSTGENKRQFANGCAFFDDKLYVCSYISGHVYEMSLDVYSEDNDTILREIVTNHISNENKRLFHRLFEVDIEKGVGLVGGGEPEVMLRFSDDGGYTWSNEITSSPGAIGDYKKRVIFRRLGSSRDRIYKLNFSDSVKWIINNSFMEVE